MLPSHGDLLWALCLQQLRIVWFFFCCRFNLIVFLLTEIRLKVTQINHKFFIVKLTTKVDWKLVTQIPLLCRQNYKRIKILSSMKFRGQSLSRTEILASSYSKWLEGKALTDVIDTITSISDIKKTLNKYSRLLEERRAKSEEEIEF